MSDQTSDDVRPSVTDEAKETAVQIVLARCEHEVFWWELDVTERCRRIAGHRGHHHDGLWWWDEDGHRTPRDSDDDE